MLGIEFIKFQPNEYVLKYRNGKVVKEGAGLAFRYYAPRTSIAMLPLASSDCPFMFEETTADFQTVYLQGQATYRIANPKSMAVMLNHTLVIKHGSRHYVSEDPQKLAPRISNLIRVIAKKEIEGLKLAAAISGSEALAAKIFQQLKANSEIKQLGLEIMGCAVLAVAPGKETARALEAETREAILKLADDAVYQRRNASIEQERKIKENEYNTEIAVENKRREVRETQLNGQQAEMQKENELKNQQLDAEIRLEEKQKSLTALKVANLKAQADAKGYELQTMMQALNSVDKQVIKYLTSAGRQPDTLIAEAFGSLAENAAKIGNLNITPDLLKELMSK